MAKKKEEVKVEVPEGMDQEAYAKLVAKAEKEGLAKAYKALGTTPEILDAIEKQNKSQKDLVEYDTGGIEVSINGQVFSTRGQAPREQVEHIMSMASAKRQRLINEKIGRDMVVLGQVSGGMSVREIKRVDEAGIEQSVQ